MANINDLLTEDENKTILGISDEDIEKIADQIYSRTDNNRPELKSSGNRFVDILKNVDRDTSSVFIKKVSL